jgi:hypothetical protein
LWLQRFAPAAHRAIRDRAPYLLTQALAGLADVIDQPSGTTTVFDTTGPVTVDTSRSRLPTANPQLPGGVSGGWADTIAKIAGPVITGIEQIKLFNTQLQLAQQGRPPLNVSQLRLPTIPVGVSLSAGGLGTPLAIGGGLALLWLLFARRRRT